MARGYIYELQKDASVVGDITEDMFFELAGHEFDYVSNRDDDESKILVTMLVDMLKGFGAEIGTETIDEIELQYLVFSDKVKEAYFADRFVRLKSIIGEMDLHNFATCDPYSVKVLIDNAYDDMVYYGTDGGLRSVDYFIRTAENGVKYYVGAKVLLMH